MASFLRKPLADLFEIPRLFDELMSACSAILKLEYHQPKCDCMIWGAAAVCASTFYPRRA